MTTPRTTLRDERETRPSSSTDATGKRIIELLQQDGRTPYVSIAAQVGLSEGAVRQRVQRLIETGVMPVSYTHLDVYKRQHTQRPPV